LKQQNDQSQVLSINENLIDTVTDIPDEYRYLVFVIYSPLDSVTALEWLESTVGKLGLDWLLEPMYHPLHRKQEFRKRDIIRDCFCFRTASDKRMFGLWCDLSAIENQQYEYTE